MWSDVARGLPLPDVTLTSPNSDTDKVTAVTPAPSGQVGDRLRKRHYTVLRLGEGKEQSLTDKGYTSETAMAKPSLTLTVPKSQGKA